MSLRGKAEGGNQTPMILEITKSTLLEIINLQRQKEHLRPIPTSSCEATVWVPGGGDWSNMDMQLNDAEHVINIRWKE